MKKDQEISANLNRHGFSHREMNQLVNKIILSDIAQRNKPTKKINQFYLGFQLNKVIKHITGKALALLRSQFAKKPKNPV